jgi:hypothetical protein
MWISKRGKDIRENEAAAQIVCAAAFYLCRIHQMSLSASWILRGQ